MASGSPNQKKDDAGKFKAWWVIVLIVVLLFLGLLGFMFFRNKALPPVNYNNRR